MTQSPSAQPDNRVAILWMVGAVLCFSVMSLFIKQASNAGIDPFQIVFARVLFGFLAILPFAFIAGPTVLKTDRHFRHFIRSIAGVTAMTLLFFGFSRLNMTETVALNFTVPFFVTIGAVLFLGETIRMRRIAATIVGFAGVLIVAQPWNQALSWGQLFPLSAAVMMAVAFLIVKDLTKTETTIRLVTFQGFWMTIFTIVPAILVWKNPSPEIWLILIGAGVIATIGQWMLVLAARQGEASVIMSFDYLRLPFVALLELTILGVVPELASLIGGGVIALAAIYMARREARIRNRSLVAESKASKTF
ncbi:MAG: DMT family transporter [Alphaproteobacteria bacterium]